jgi:hypothetical protein
MKHILKPVLAILVLAGLWLMDFSPEAPLTPVVVGDAEAIVGAPLTPVSVGGVARRTTRRAVVYGSSASNQAAQQEAAAAQQQAAQAEADAAAAQQQAAAAQQQADASRLPSGTVVTALPSGCESITVDGVSLFNCGGVMYKPQFQSNNLVYVVQ